MPTRLRNLYPHFGKPANPSSTCCCGPGGHLIDPRNGLSAVRDVAVHDGRVAAVEEAIDPGRAFKVVEMTGFRNGLYVTPGLIDLHRPRNGHVFARRARAFNERWPLRPG